MNRNVKCLMLVVVCGGFSMGPVPNVQAQANHFYARGDIGGEWTLDTRVEKFFGEPISGGRVKFDPGFRLGFTGGYQVTDWFSVEGQTGVMENRIDSISGADRVDEVTFANVPFLVNARIQCPAQCRVSPYIGGGVGGSASVIDADHLSIGFTTMHGSDSTVVFAYQAFGGVKFRINDQMNVGVEYRYFATGDPEWQAENTFGTLSDRMRFSGVQTHAVSLMFEYTF